MATYSGYKNYETWAVALWISNEESSYNYWREVAQEILDSVVSDRDADPTEDEMDDATGQLASRIKDEFEESQPQLDGV